MMTIREGRWDCPSCGHRGNRGPIINCAGCGVARDQTVEFYLPEDALAVTDEKQIAEALTGPDWQCEHCQTENHAFQETCQHCGATLDSDPVRQVIEEGLVPTAPLPATADETEEEPLSTGDSHLGRWLIGIGLAVALIVSGVYLLFYREYERPIRVTGFTWERAVEVQAYRTVAEEDWSVPNTGRKTGEFRAIHHYDRVLDHYETVRVPYRTQTGTRTVHHRRNLGNGHYSDYTTTEPVYGTRYRSEQRAVYRKDPVYRTKYRYDIERWVFARTETARGADHNARWPELKLTEKERRGKATEAYTATFRDEGGDHKSFTRPYDFTQWETFKVNEVRTGVFNYVGSLLEVKEPILLER